jgi:hypothetical protein
MICCGMKNLNAKARSHKEIDKLFVLCEKVLGSLRETIKSHAEAESFLENKSLRTIQGSEICLCLLAALC